MARIVVTGGGIAGLSAAARLAKLRHEVVLVEAADVLGGRLRPYAAGDTTWHLTPPTFTMPGAVRDLFRKSGRPLERVLEITPVGPRRHVFDDRSVLDLPHAPRSAQHDAIVEVLGQDDWSPWVDGWSDAWDVVRRRTLDVLPDPESLDRAARRTLGGRRDLARQVRRGLRDRRLRSLVLDPVRLGGEDPRWVPVAEAVWPYVERSFDRWIPAGGTEALADALTTRLQERRVEVRTGTRALEVTGAAGAFEVATDQGPLRADVVVWCHGPVPDVHVGGLLPRIPAHRTLLRLGPGAPDLPREVMTHADPPMQLWRDDDRLTVAHQNPEDPLVALVRVGIDLREHVVERHDLSPAQLVSLGHWGWQWMGRGTRFDRPSRLREGLYVAGAHAHPGPTIELIMSATAAIADELGAAPR